MYRKCKNNGIYENIAKYYFHFKNTETGVMAVQSCQISTFFRQGFETAKIWAADWILHPYKNPLNGKFSYILTLALSISVVQ